MTNAEDAPRDLSSEIQRFTTNRIEELLGQDPELIRLYYLSCQRSEMEISLRKRLTALTDFAETPFFQLAEWVCNYKDVAERAKGFTPVEEIAADVADALETAAERLRFLASEVRNQAAELPVLGSEEIMKKVQKADIQACEEAIQKYRS